MFPLFDLDDKTMVSMLGFSDPHSLCLATMTCRRIRRLTDAAWTKLEKNIPADKREEGRTPRKRVLSSYVVHERSSWVSSIAQDVSRRNKRGQINSKSTKDRKYPVITNEELRQNDSIFYLYICQTPYKFMIDERNKSMAMMMGTPTGLPDPYIDSFVKITEQQCIDLSRGLSIDVPIKIEQAMGKFGPFLRKLYGGPGSFSERNIDQYGKFHDFAFDEIGYCLFLDFDITLLSVRRRFCATRQP